jgi:diguanylate cyclase (GGDEF)-like protein
MGTPPVRPIRSSAAYQFAGFLSRSQELGQWPREQWSTAYASTGMAFAVIFRMNLNILPSRERRTERSQAIARMVIGGFAYTYLIIASFIFDDGIEPTVIWSAGGFLLFSFGLYLSIRLRPQPSLPRRVVGIVADLGITSYGFYMLGPYSGVFYPIYLWVIVGNGLRFGTSYLFFAMGVGFCGLLLAIGYSVYWQGHLSLAVGLLIGLVVLPLFYAVILRELNIANEKLEQQVMDTAYAATHDPLTGLPNRFLFLDRLRKTIDIAKHQKHSVALLFIDLDNFKNINDKLGHTVGDRFLADIGMRIQHILREGDTVSRIGGDEFVCLLTHNEDTEGAIKAATRLLEELRKSSEIDGHRLQSTVSIGISLYPVHGEDIDIIVHRADTAMYVAKANGGNCYWVYKDSEMVKQRQSG